jgi:hypothetical protein
MKFNKIWLPIGTATIALLLVGGVQAQAQRLYEPSTGTISEPTMQVLPSHEIPPELAAILTKQQRQQLKTAMLKGQDLPKTLASLRLSDQQQRQLQNVAMSCRLAPPPGSQQGQALPAPLAMPIQCQRGN